MLGMEMLFANMLGIKPEEMQDVVKKVISTIEQAGRDIQYIRARLDTLHPVELPDTPDNSHLETDNDSGESGNRVEL